MLLPFPGSVTPTHDAWRHISHFVTAGDVNTRKMKNESKF